ncbi:MAG: hypothetical protein KAU50_10885 [Candidatus Marinimicrobia bacterium]|nr:hypothetical protein [Candidatus Neomarinimicrobiota bacterium]
MAAKPISPADLGYEDHSTLSRENQSAIDLILTNRGIWVFKHLMRRHGIHRQSYAVRIGRFFDLKDVKRYSIHNDLMRIFQDEGYKEGSLSQRVENYYNDWFPIYPEEE